MRIEASATSNRRRRRLPLLEGSLIVSTGVFCLMQFIFASRHFEAETNVAAAADYSLRTIGKSTSISDGKLYVTSHAEIVPTSPYAYSFIIGGIHPTNIAYKGFLYNVLIAARLLRRLGSTADMICHLQLLDNFADPSAEHEPLILEDLRALKQMNVSAILLLPTTTNTSTSSTNSFTNLMMNKFQALQLTQYRRVLYLDSDVMPLSNLDYLFHLSDPKDTTTPTLLQPNVIQASSGEPANGGMFLMEPKPGRYQQLLQVMNNQRQHQVKQAKENGAAIKPFDNRWGWGHDFVENGDNWHAATRNGTLWWFHGGFADQGLLYYLLKYHVQQVSAIVGSRVEDWVAPGPQLANCRENLLLPYAPTPLIVHPTCQDGKVWKSYKCYPPYRDVYHFVGRSKPWQNPFQEKWFQRPQVKNLKGRSKLWFLEFRALNQELMLGLDIPNWNTKYFPYLKESPLGYIPLLSNKSQALEDAIPTEDNIDDDSSPQVLDSHDAPPVENVVTDGSNSRYAYAYIVGSVHENRTAYKGFLYNVLISVQLLQRFGSKADHVIYLQPSPSSRFSRIPDEDLQCLKAMNIQIITLPKPQVENFSDLMFDKFRIFQLIQYDRVIYLDADILPLTNLDYLFALSDPNETSVPTPLLPNVMQASSGEPANGGLFMVRPFEGAWEQIQKVIERQREEGKTLPYPNFHRGRGWGHKFRKKNRDNWHGAVNNGTNWVFHGAHADQGLLYYFFRFVLQETSHIVGRRVENWVANASDPEMPCIGVAYDNILMEYSDRQPPILSNPKCTVNSEILRLHEPGRQISYNCYPPYRDFYHFTGRSKPWQNEIEEKWLESDILLEANKEHATAYSNQFWFWQLETLNRRLGLGLDLTHWNSRYLPTMKESPLGYIPLYTDNTNRIFDNYTQNN